MAESVKDMSSKFAKLEKFDGIDFRRWQKKMHFLLTGLKVVYVLSTPAPEEKEDETLDQTRRRNKWENDDYVCRGFILNGMSDPLFDIYQNHESAKDLWDALESKYMAEDASSKKFLVSNWNNYKMVDTRPVMEQYNEIMRILGQFEQHHMKMDESISVSSVIDKLPPSWKDFKHTLKHQKEELSLVQLGSHLRIEESLRDQETVGKGKEKVIPGSSINMVEDGHKQKSNKFNKKRKRDDNPKGANKKEKMVCWYCNKPGHLKRDCRLRKNKGCASASHHHGSTSGHGHGSKDQDPKPNQGQNFNLNVNSGITPIIYTVTLILEAFYVKDDDHE